MTLSNTTIATLDRVVMAKHMCPRRKSLGVLRRDGDHHLTTRATVDALKDWHGVETTPQALIDGQRIAGDDDLRPRFSKTVRDSTATPYRAVRDGDGKPLGRVRMRPDAVSGHGSARCEQHHARTRRCVSPPCPVFSGNSIALGRPKQARHRFVHHPPQSGQVAPTSGASSSPPLVAVMERHSRKAIRWRLLNAMDARFCVETLKEALAKHAPAKICHSDQGAQVTTFDVTKMLLEASGKISMHGRGRWIDNRMTDRLQWPHKDHCVHLKAFGIGS